MAAGIPLLPFLAPVLSAWLTPHTLAIQAPSAIGTYVLATAGTHQLPIEAARIMPYEGPTLHSVHLELMPAGKLLGEIVVSFTDSGTVTDTVLLDGHWKATGVTARLTYRWLRPRWLKGTRRFDLSRPINGILTHLSSRLPELY